MSLHGRNDRVTTRGSTLYQTAFFLVIWRRRVWAGRPLCVFAYQQSAYFVCAVIPPPIVVHGGGWKTSALTQIHREAWRDKTIAKLIEKPLITVLFFLLLYRCVGLLNRGTTPHWKQSFHPHGKTFIRVRTTPNILITGHFNGLQITPTHCDHCVLSCLDLE